MEVQNGWVRGAFPPLDCAGAQILIRVGGALGRLVVQGLPKKQCGVAQKRLVDRQYFGVAPLERFQPALMTHFTDVNYVGAQEERSMSILVNTVHGYIVPVLQQLSCQRLRYGASGGHVIHEPLVVCVVFLPHCIEPSFQLRVGVHIVHHLGQLRLVQLHAAPARLLHTHICHALSDHVVGGYRHLAFGVAGEFLDCLVDFQQAVFAC